MNTHNPIMAALLAEESVSPKFRAAVANYEWTPTRVRDALLAGKAVTSIGQLSAEAIKQLERWERRGAVIRGVSIAHPIAKTAWIIPEAFLSHPYFFLADPRDQKVATPKVPA